MGTGKTRPLAVFLVGLLLLASGVAPAQKIDLEARGQDHFYNLEYAEALRDYQAAIKEQPASPRRRNLLAQAVLFSLMLRSGALETQLVTGNNPFLRRPKMDPTPEERKLFEDSVSTAISLCDERLQKDPKDTDAMYSKGIAMAMRGNYNFLVAKAWMDALRDLTAARRLHNELTTIDPNRIDARLLEGMHDYIVGSMPLAYRMLGFLAGFRGDKEEGLRIVKLVSEKGENTRVDAKIMLGVAYRREKRPQDVVPIIQELSRLYPRNYLFLMELSQMYADLGDKANAVAALDRVEQLKKSGAPGYKALLQEKIEYARGNLLFWYDDLDEAISHLRKASTKIHDLDMNSGVLTYFRLGQCYDLKNDRSAAVSAYRQAIAFAPQSEVAREARRYLDRPYRREKSS